MLERTYQPKVIKRLRREFPGCVILKNDSQYLQGIPDLIILFGGRWATLEVKASESSPKQPNQEYYVGKLNDIGGFAAFIYPEIEDEVFRALQSALQPFGVPCAS